MNLDQMAYLIALKQAPTLSQAARNLNISQAGLSQSLDNLESELGIKLFTRTRNGTQPTKAGEKIIGHAQKIETQLRMMQKLADQQKQVAEPPLRIGVTNDVPSSLFNWLLEFQDSEPQFKAYLKEADSTQIIAGVKNNDYDVGIVAINTAEQRVLKSLEFREIGRGEFKLYMATSHYLANSPDPIPLELLKEQEFALFIDDDITKFVDAVAIENGPLNITVQSSSSRVILEAMRKFQAVSVIRDAQMHNCLNDFEQQSLVEHTLGELGSDLSRTFKYGIIQLPGKHLTPVQEAFISGIKPLDEL
ncbi:LysR family transcriptional regulator [Levilactobacillus yiduensis]|uniref:LysR family transcriptional regulator n=1 Tax=Levilactobacillus yiduensis TaxID=2953880 RepID=UPI000EF31FED|nr:LysR family transcriptional regulator [Levilactobacillus yiduensis]AYM01771.1 LysR family transcriptional regulator [Levilactobacillus brevis]